MCKKSNKQARCEHYQIQSSNNILEIDKKYLMRTKKESTKTWTDSPTK